jgi:acyl carrier protein
METAEKLRAFIKQNFYAAQKMEIGVDDSLLELGIIDSTGVLELVAYLEEQFGVRVPDEEIVPENLDSIAAIVQFLTKKGAA